MRCLTVLFLLAATGSALADVETASGKAIDCYCTDSTGGRVELGEVICLHVDGRMFLARCEMALNNPFWREVQEGCTTSRLQSMPLTAPTTGRDAEETARGIEFSAESG